MEHVRCPRCDYDLFGIPEHRCPECGYGYDHEAIRALAAGEAAKRLAAARGIIRSSVICAALTVFPLLASLDASRPLQIVLGTSSLIVAEFVRRRFAQPKAPMFFDAPIFDLVFLPAGLGLAAIIYMLPKFGVLLAVIAVTRAWLTRLTDWRAITPSAASLPAVVQREVRRHSAGALIALGLASGLTILSLLTI